MPEDVRARPGPDRVPVGVVASFGFEWPDPFVAVPFPTAPRARGELEAGSGSKLAPGAAIAAIAGWVLTEAAGVRATRTSRLAAAIHAAQPLAPLESARRLQHPAYRDQFILRVLVYHRWQCLRAAGPTPADLVAFQTEHKYLVLAHDPERSRDLGRLVSQAGRSDVDIDALADAYGRELMAALARPPGRRAHYNALQHAAGHLRGRIGEAERAAIHQAIERFATGAAPLAEPMELLRRHRARAGSDWLARQRYLDASPTRPGRDDGTPRRYGDS